jgi:DNA-directed RNA polymerase specialized sigma subunit
LVALEEASDAPRAEVGHERTDLFVTCAVKRFIGLLPDKLRTLYELVYVKGCTQREAAAELGVTQPRVAQLHADLLQRGHQELGYLFL